MDWSLISKRVWNKIDQSEELEKSFSQAEHVDLFKGSARFTGKQTLLIDFADGSASRSISGEKIIIAVGGRSFIPPIEGLLEAGCLTAESFFGEQYPDRIWKSLVILGGGAVGLEFAHIFSALGTQVTLIEMKDRLATTEEPDISRLLQQQMEMDGVSVLTETRVESVERLEHAKLIHAIDPSGQKIQIECEEVLIASGIRSNADRLALSYTEIQTDDKGWIITDEYLATTQEHVWAIGDINGKFQFRHKANYEAEILAHNLFSGEKSLRYARYDVVPWAIFTHPQVAHVGLTEQQALDAGHTVLTGKNPYSAVANGYAMGYEDNDPDNGFVKLITDDQHKILGVHIAGPQAAILLQPYVYLMNAGSSCERRKGKLQGSPITEGRMFRMSRKSREEGCLDADSTDAIDHAMIIHPALSEVAGWVTEELGQTQNNNNASE